jgi:ABC-type dipeptide/oligopeptide/nickel transport system permease subunit
VTAQPAEEAAGAFGVGGLAPPIVPLEVGAPSVGPWRTAWRTLRRNRTAMLALAAFALIVLACLAAPLYAEHIAHTDAFTSNINGTTVVDGKTVPLLQNSTAGLGLGVTPIGPTWDPRHYFLGADNQGRDVAARLLYGGRNSLMIGLVSAILCCVIATVVGVVAGYSAGRWTRCRARPTPRFLVYLPRLPVGRSSPAACTSGRSTSRPAACCCRS